MALVTDAPPVWLITGCSTGLGRAIAMRVLQHGHRAVVTSRDGGSIQDIVAPHPDNALALALDVTDSARIAQAVDQAHKRFGRIDVLVNNAGYGYLAAVEEGEDEQVRAMFEANFFGLAALTRRVLTGMRERRCGHVINITSIGGMLGNPGSGYYNATKFAVEGLTDALAKEVASLGIHVTAIEPGPFRTDWAGRSLKRTARPIADYAATVHARVAEVTRNSGTQPGDPLRAAQAIIEVVESPAPPGSLVLGRMALTRLRARLDQLARTLDEWEKVTLGADYPAT